ncbi:MAG TPA: DUF4442 domain-containing protein [Ktedonobacteraceae bacterium]|nr:DUF4442 domain-containing protein [Ktedonobacteraceae bacterium]
MDIWQQVLDFEPFLRLLDIQAELLGPDEVVLRLSPRREISNHLGGLHGGAQFTLGETTALTAAVLSLGMSLDQVAVLTRGATISYQKTGVGDLVAHACVMHEEREGLRATWQTRRRARLNVPVEVADASGQVVTVLTVACLVLPR